MHGNRDFNCYCWISTSLFISTITNEAGMEMVGIKRSRQSWQQQLKNPSSLSTYTFSCILAFFCYLLFF